jgi:hypothetical protein
VVATDALLVTVPFYLTNVLHTTVGRQVVIITFAFVANTSDGVPQLASPNMFRNGVSCS